MSILKVLIYPDPRLRLKAEPVTVFDAALKETVNSMYQTMYAEKGVGLAAIQVDIQKQVIVMDCSENGDEPLCIINPKILSLEGDVMRDEGCLSFPGLYAQVKRAVTVSISYQDLEGKNHTLTATDLLGHCIQHEMDHLNGIVFVDYLTPLKRDVLLKKMSKYIRSERL